LPISAKAEIELPTPGRPRDRLEYPDCGGVLHHCAV